MDNYIGPGETCRFVASGAVTAGSIVVLPELVGVAAEDVADTATGVMAIEGEFEYTKTAGTAHAIGDLLDYDVSANSVSKGITPASGDVTNFAVCTEAAGSAATRTKFKLLPGAGTHA